MDEAGCEPVINTMQGNCTLTNIQDGKIYDQRDTSQNDRVNDWEDQTLLSENHIFND